MIGWEDDSLSCSYRLGGFWLAIRVEDGEQRRRYQNSPERNNETHDDRNEGGRPPGHTVLPLHQVGLKDQSVDDCDECVGDEQSDEMLLIGSREQHCHGRPDERQDGSEVGYELEGSGQQGPQQREGHVQEEQRHQPHGGHSQRVVALGDEPALEGSESDVRVVADGHTTLMLAKNQPSGVGR
jgi:hypothetical protein